MCYNPCENLEVAGQEKQVAGPTRKALLAENVARSGRGDEERKRNGDDRQQARRRKQSEKPNLSSMASGASLEALRERWLQTSAERDICVHCLRQRRCSTGSRSRGTKPRWEMADLLITEFENFLAGCLVRKTLFAQKLCDAISEVITTHAPFHNRAVTPVGGKFSASSGFANF